MLVGAVKEIKDQEHRVALTPDGAETLARAGHSVLVEAGAGLGSGFADQEYAAAGARIEAEAARIWEQADLLVKVKEPLPPEYPLLRPGLLLFTYLHLAAEPRLTQELLAGQVTALGYETVQLPDGRLPLLAPMSEVAGKLAVQIGAHYLERPNGGSGKLLGGVPGVPPCRVVILGGGTVGTSAAQVALGMGAEVSIVDVNLDRLRYLDQALHGRLETVASSHAALAELLPLADLAIGGVLVAGARAPRLVDRAMVGQMPAGAVIVDVAIDQGGCFETSRLTRHSAPTYRVDEVIHYAVPNMPGAVPHTSTVALSNATLPYIAVLAERGFERAIATVPELARGVNTHRGVLTSAAVAEALGLEHAPLAGAAESEARPEGSSREPAAG
jgi:alanine dehydrogenase